jgi:hypothetical protein
VQDSDLSVSSNGVALAFDQQPTGATASAVIDLGAGALGSDGRSCIFGGAIYDPEASRYNLAAENNWWGTAKGPVPGKVVETVPGYKVDTSSPLRHAGCEIHLTAGRDVPLLSPVTGRSWPKSDGNLANVGPKCNLWTVRVSPHARVSTRRFCQSIAVVSWLSKKCVPLAESKSWRGRTSPGHA